MGEEKEYFTLSIPEEHVVLLQSIVESYEGIGVVRTEQNSTNNAVVKVLTTADQYHICSELLNNLMKEFSGWQYLE